MSALSTGSGSDTAAPPTEMLRNVEQPILAIPDTSDTLARVLLNDLIIEMHLLIISV